MMDTYTASYY